MLRAFLLTSIQQTNKEYLPTTRRKLSEGLCQVVEDYGLVKYVPLAIQVSL